MARRRPSIPVYRLGDLASSARSAEVADVEVWRFEDAFTQVKPDVTAAHRHDFYEVFWITSGRGTCWIDFAAFPIRPRMLCFVSPGQVHGWDIAAGVVAGYLLAFRGEFLSANPDSEALLLRTPFFRNTSDPQVLRVGDGQADAFSRLFEEIGRECRDVLADRDTIIRAMLNVLLVRAERMHGRTEPTAAHARDGASMLAQRFLILVQSHFLTASSVTEYARMLGVTPNHLTATIKRAFGRPAGLILRERVLLEAQRLLRYSELSVSEVGYRVGFEDASYFSRFFRKQTGQTPVEFRQRL